MFMGHNAYTWQPSHYSSGLCIITFIEKVNVLRLTSSPFFGLFRWNRVHGTANFSNSFGIVFEPTTTHVHVYTYIRQLDELLLNKILLLQMVPKPVTTGVLVWTSTNWATYVYHTCTS